MRVLRFVNSFRVTATSAECAGGDSERPPVDVRIDGFLERRYDEPTDDGTAPGEFLSPIGGLTAQCKAKARRRIVIEAGLSDEEIWVAGRVNPGGSQSPVLIVVAGGPEGDVIAREIKTTNSGAFETRFALREVIDRHPELSGSGVRNPDGGVALTRDQRQSS
jgi:hypothetical protein